MYKKLLDKYESVTSRKLTFRVVITSVIMLVILVLLVGFITQPVRSVVSYCKVYKDEKTRLEQYSGSSFPSGVFNKTLGDANQFVISFGRLESVAPDDIRPDVTTLKKIYQTMRDNPAQTITAGLSGAGAEDSVKTWTTNNCGVKYPN